ncbi:MAG: hypothetical protein R2715_08845 [Ilumatobacteraceae bacterium]
MGGEGRADHRDRRTHGQQDRDGPAGGAHATPAEAERPLEEDDGDGEGNARKEQIAERLVRVDQVQDRSCDDPAREQEDDRRDLQPPTEPLGEHSRPEYGRYDRNDVGMHA